MVDYNVEFAHIYANEKFGSEQIHSIEILKEVLQKLKKENKTFVTCILIDEFNPSVSYLDDKRFLKEVKKFGVPVDFIGYESKVVTIGDKLLKELPKSKLKLEHFHNPQKDVLLLQEGGQKIGLREHYDIMYRHTCALLSAAWTLCRLGKYQIPRGSVKALARKDFKAKKVITILPEKYREGEMKVLEIIGSTKFKARVSDIEYRFFKP